MMTKLFNSLLIGFLFFTFSSYGQDIKKTFSDAEKQTRVMLAEIGKTSGNAQNSQKLVSPRTLSPEGNLVMVTAKDWTSGFFPGVLWYLYEYTGNNEWKKQAQEFTANLEKEKWNAGTHDMGFKIYCSFGTGYQATKDTAYRSVIVQAAKTLSKRFYPKVGCIRSWDHSRDKWAFPVIIDNMMNLELLFAATRLTGDSSFYRIAVSHAKTTMKNHFRKDYSSYHVVDYDSLTGNVIKRTTHQGYSNESAWARGQAWALYGFTMCYRETKDKSFLDQASHIASFILSNPNLPKDLVPYWDYNAPGIPSEPRDASAAAVMASAFYELDQYAPKNNYRKVADNILNSLTTFYRSPIGENKGFILIHSTGSKPFNVEVDVPLNYADYYYLEALIRSEKSNENKPLFSNEDKGKIRVFSLDINDLSATKLKIQYGDSQAVATYRKLLAVADKALTGEPYTVMHKTQMPPSGDKHDYMSLAPYFWPNPKTPGGLPYIRKDGEHNPDINKVKDKNDMLNMERDVEKLSLACYFSGNEKYADRAALLIRTWFLLPATRMNPNVNYGQAVLGTTEGRGEGVLETRGIDKVIDAIGLIRSSKFWTDKDQDEMQNWITEFLHWMQTSVNGKDEMNAGNNHGVWYDAQELDYALFLKDSDLVHHIYIRALNRLDKQMDKDGSFPKELARTNSLGYSVFVMQAFFQIATLADNAGLDFWNAVTPSGKSLKKGVEFLSPYLLKEKEWSHKQIKPYNYDEAKPFLEMASQKIKPVKHLLDSSSYHSIRGGLKNSFLKFTKEKKGRVAFLGGSITESKGHACRIVHFLVNEI